MSSFFISPSTEYRQESWINLVLVPALSQVALIPGDSVQIVVEALEGTDLVDLEGRLVGFSEVASSKDCHEFLSIPLSISPSEFDNDPNDDSPTTRPSFSTFFNLPLFQTCTCSRGAEDLSESIPLPPSYESEGNKIEYYIEVTGKIDKGSKDRKGKGKWKLFKEKLKTERRARLFLGLISIRANLTSLLSHSISIPSGWRYNSGSIIAQDSISHDLCLDSQLTSSVDRNGQLRPSFKYTLLASLGQHVPSTLPLLSSSLQLASSYAHFVLEESTTINTPPHPRLNFKRVRPLIHRGERASNSLDSGLMHCDQPGTIDGVWELVHNDREGGETPEEVFVKFEGEFEVELPERGVGDEESLIPIRTCQLEVRYDLTVTFQFGSDFNSLVMLKSTNLPLHVGANQLVSKSDKKTNETPASSQDKLEEEVLVNSEPSPNQISSSPPLYPTASTSISRQPEDLPAYDSSARPLSAGEEKRQLASNEQAQQSTSISRLPEYTQASTEVGLTEEVGARDPEEPPSWEETVRDDMIDDWVAASVAFGEDGPD
ncbi:hypothetical protein JCM3765_003074 [Sporobolomyces pararoseus]